MPNEKIKELPEVEQEELKRILDLPNVKRLPTVANIEHLLKRMDCLTPDEIKQFGLLRFTDAPFTPENEKLGLVGQVADIVSDKPQKPKKSPKIAPKKAVKAKKPAKKAIKKAAKKIIKGKRK